MLQSVTEPKFIYDFLVPSAKAARILLLSCIENRLNVVFDGPKIKHLICRAFFQTSTRYVGILLRQALVMLAIFFRQALDRLAFFSDKH